MIQHLHTSGPSHVNSVPFYESDHQVTGVSDTRFRIYTNHIDTTKKLLVAAAKESAGIGDPLAITLDQSNELATMSREETLNLLRKYQDQAQKLRADAEAAEASLQALKDAVAARDIARLHIKTFQKLQVPHPK